MSRLSRNKLEGGGYATDLIKTLAPLVLSPISSSLGERIGSYISPRRSSSQGSGYRTMGMGYRTMGMGLRKSSKRKSSRSSSRRKSSYTKKSYKRKSSYTKKKKGGMLRRHSKSKTARRRSPVRRR